MLDSEELHCCVVLYFDPKVLSDWVYLFRDFTLKYSNCLGRLLTHFDFWFEDDETKLYKYIKRNEKKFSYYAQDKTLKGLTFYSVGEDKDFFEAPFSSTVDTQESIPYYGPDRVEHDAYGTAIIKFKLDLYKTVFANFSLNELIDDMETIVRYQYGFVDLIQGRKYPALYYSGSASSQYLTPKEKKDVETWRKYGWKYPTLIRDIYWANVISKSHWGHDKQKENYLSTELKHECEDNVQWIDKDTLYFHAPFDILDYEEDKMEEFRQRIYKLMADCDIEVLANR